MNLNDASVRDLISQEAADWFVTNRASPSATEQGRFVAWLKASPVHVEEYLALSVIARDLHAACGDSQGAAEALLSPTLRVIDTQVRSPWMRLIGTLQGVASYRWQTVAAAIAVLAALGLGLLIPWNSETTRHPTEPSAPPELSYATGHGEQHTYRLADSSVVHLNTDSAVTVRYNAKERVIVLSAGEAEFEVTHEPGRVFRVLAGAAEIVDVGTRFNVRLQENTTVVTVVEGRVAVALADRSNPRTARSGHPTSSVQVNADQQLTVSQGEWPATPEVADPQRTTAWLHRQIIFENEPLGHVTKEFNRYTSKPIEIVTPALRDLEISGVFATDDIDAFIAFLRSLDGVHIEVTATRIRVLERKK